MTAQSWQIRFFDQIESTQDLALQEARDGAPSKTVIIARQQIAGRGRGGNSWVSMPGNLLCSCILRPTANLHDIGHYAFIVAVALASTMLPHLKKPENLQLKWPNDVLLNSQKVAGILIETVLTATGNFSALVIGVGANLTHAPPERTHLAEHAHHPVTVETFSQEFLTQMDGWIMRYESEGFAPIRHRWLELAVGLNQPIRVRLPVETLYGVFSGLDETGALKLLLDTGETRMIRSGEVFLT